MVDSKSTQNRVIGCVYLIKKLGFLIETIRTIKNWPTLLLFYLGLKQSATVVFRNNISVKIAEESKALVYKLIKISLNSRVVFSSDRIYKVILGNLEVVLSLDDENSIYKAYILSCLYDKLKLRFYPENLCEFCFGGKKIKYYFDPEDFTSIGNLFITFVDKQYAPLNVRKKIVADIGAAFGDTALYFALQGAQEIHAYEPVPWVVKILEKNVAANNLSDIIKIHPCAVSISEGASNLIVLRKATEGASIYYELKNPEAIQISVQKSYPPLNVDVAKINCEGCEYDIILKWLNKKIYAQIILNYHENYEQLERKLKEIGYKVKINSVQRLLIAS
jgi:FkbM family methyltransferase